MSGITRWLPAAVWMAAIFTFSSVQGSVIPSAVSAYSPIAHFTEYAILGALLVFATRGRPFTARLAVCLLLACSLYGVTDEFHQSFVAGRMPDPVDWVVDTAGAGAAIAAIAASRTLRAPR